MGAQFQRLTKPCDLGPEAVQAHLAWNLEYHHVVSQTQLQLPERIPEPPQPGANRRVWPWQRLILTGTLPCALNSALRREHCPTVGSVSGATWDLTLHLNLNLFRTGNLQ